ncbi:NlpD protein [Pasteurella multocida subsp. multocida str. Anand1_cattle]|nr:NlpD protein [Pasteurella multocida subsp. multocida str. Anand1_cattle]
MPPLDASTGCIIPGDKLPSALSTGAGVFELQAANTATLIGNVKTTFSFASFLFLISEYLN